MFVVGEVQEPMAETVNLVEDIVRSQIIELVREPFTQNRKYYILSSVNNLSIHLSPGHPSQSIGFTTRGALSLRRRPYLPYSTRQG